MTRAVGKAAREGSLEKRAAILAAARELFPTAGYERTSVDAIAAQAQVSKRTVYDYFGDKQALLLAVVEQAGESLLARVREALHEELSDQKNLEAELIAFATRVATAALGSAEYAALVRLVGMESTHLPELAEHWLTHAPEDALAERFAELGRDGLLHVPDPRLAADHFIALTFGLVQNRASPTPAGAPEVQRLLVEGVRVFLRAYAAGPGGGA